MNDEKIEQLLGYHYTSPTPYKKDSILFRVISAGCDYCNENFEIIRDKDYPYYTLHILFDGCGFFHISNHDYLLKKGDAFVITPGKAHTYSNFTSASLGLLWIELAGGNCSELFSYFRSNDLYALRDTVNEKTGNQLLDLLEYLNKQNPVNPYELSGRVYTLLMYLLEAATGISKEKMPTLIAKALTYIDENFTEQIRVSDIADNLHISHTYLTKLFQKNIGTSPLKYINLKRIEYACYLLQTTDLSCESVSEKIGMYDNAYFYKVFKSVNGLTPIGYKSSNKSFL